MASNKQLARLQLVLVVAFIGGAFAISKLLEATHSGPAQNVGEERSVFVEATRVAPRAFPIEFSTTGVVQAKADIAVVPQVSGRVVQVAEAFYQGGQFAAGEVLFVIEPRDYQVQLKAARAELARAQTALQLEQARAQTALRDWRATHGSEPAPALVLRKPQLDEAQANISAAEARVENAQIDLQRTEFSLPFAGRVLQSQVALGQFISAGQVYGQVFDSGELEVRATLSEHQLRWLQGNRDSEVVVSVVAEGEQKNYSARFVRGVAQLDERTRFAPVQFAFAEPPMALLPGSFVAVKIQGPVVDGVTVIPASSLQKQGMVWAISADNTLRALYPKTLLNQGQNVAVTGIDQAVTIVTSRVPGGTPGMRVKTETTTNTSVDKQ